MKNVSIKTKLWANLGLFLTFALIMWGLTFVASSKISGYLDSSKVEVMTRADQLRQSLKDLEKLSNDAAQLAEPALLVEADRRADDFREAMAALMRLDPEHLAEYRNASDHFDTYQKASRRAAELLIAGQGFSEELMTLAGEVNQTLPTLRKDVDRLLERIYEDFTGLLERSTHVATLLVTQTFVLMITLVMLSGIIFPMIIRSITRPIERLVYATNELAKGNLETQAEVISVDEIGVLALSFNRMARALKEKSDALEKTTWELSQALEIRKEMQKRIVEVNQDLTEANERLQEADRLKSDFLASMSHELRTPLNAMINFSEQIIEDWDQLFADPVWAKDALGMLQRVLKNSRHLLSLINDLLDLAKIESGHVTLDLARVDLREVVADAAASVSALAKNKGLALTHRWPDDLPPFLLDERRILQALINLLGNAIKFTDEGSVEIVVERAEVYPHGVVVSVIDTGVGISEADQKVIFDRFRQVDSGNARKHAGTGLGLNLVKELVELHGGSVGVTSQPGRGSTFFIRLPFTAIPPQKHLVIT
ncbi:MAG: HAMP domain-containing protein [Nitrospinae bacterium]|nr:HAMP domain-containing protein [Nitrospinota bacterium]